MPNPRSLVVVIASVIACTSDPVTPVSGPPATIELLTTLPAEVQLGTPLALEFRISDSSGIPLSGVSVTFSQGLGTGTFTPAEVVTGPGGIAATSWVTTASAGTAFGGAVAGGIISTHFDVITTPAPAAVLMLEGADSLTGVANGSVDNGIRLRVLDAFGNGVAGVALTGTASSGSLPFGIPATDDGGYAYPVWDIGPETGTQHLTIQGAGLADLVIPAIVLQAKAPRTLAVSVNRTHACRILLSNGAECWGSNTNGQLGNGTDLPVIGPTVVQGGHEFVSISIGGLNNTQRNGSCAVTALGEVWCWGFTPAGSPPGLPLRLQVTQRFQFVEQGEAHVCGLDVEGQAWCWGANASGQLGVGDFNPRTVPARVATADTFRDLSAGANHTCGLTRRGQVRCWGSGTSGRLGIGTTTTESTPTPIASGLRFVALDLGAAHSCAIAVGGGLHCWGSNGNGRIAGDGVQGGAVLQPQPVRPELNFRRVTAGVGGTCGITEAGAGWCWGSNSAHQLADETSTQLKPAGSMEGGHAWHEIVLGETSGCGTTSLLETRCWGFNGDGVVGHEDAWRFPTPQPVAGGHFFVDIATGFFHSCGLKGDGTTWCWGNNQDSLLGAMLVTRAETPVQVTSVPPFSAISASGNSACGIAAGGRVLCWGAATTGDGPVVRSSTPREVLLPEPATTLHQGWQMGCATLQSGDVWCWGPGNGNTTPAAAPARVDAPEPLSGVTVGIGWACGLGASGTAHCWNRRADAGAPYPVTALNGGAAFAAVAAGNSGVCAITDLGVSVCTNPGGALAPLNPPLPLTSIAPGSYVTCGRTAGDAAVCWGNNEFGQVGRGDLVEFVGASIVQGGLTWSQLAPSTGHTCGLTPSGVAYCWGSAQTGELGNGVSRYFPSPVVVP